MYNSDGSRTEELELTKCEICGKLIAHIKFPWDDGGGQNFYCLECKPLTKEEREMLEFAEYQAKKRAKDNRIE